MNNHGIPILPISLREAVDEANDMLDAREPMIDYSLPDYRLPGMKHSDYIMLDDVNQPDHYMAGGMEAIDVIKAKLTPEEWRGYLKGNTLKYLLRCNYKGSHDKDVCKASYYITRLANEATETNS